MKKVILLLTLLTFLITVKSYGQTSPTIITFKTHSGLVKIGDSLKDLPKMEYKRTDGIFKYYKLPNDNQYLNQKPISYTEYGFSNNKLSIILIVFTEPTTYGAGYKLLSGLFGEGEQVTQGKIIVAQWYGDEVSYGIRYSLDSNDGYLITGYNDQMIKYFNKNRK